MLPLPNNFRYLNREGRWLDFHWTGLGLTSDGSLQLLSSPGLTGTPPDLSGAAVPTAPAGVAVDASGRILFGDPDQNTISAVGGCSPSLTQLTCLTEDSGLGPLNQPRGLLILDDPHRLVVVDSGNHRILFFDLVDFRLRDVWGPSDATANPTPGTQPGQFNTPWTVSADGDGNLYVLDYGNRRVQKFRRTGEPDLQFANRLQLSKLIPHPGALAVAGTGSSVNVFVFDIDAGALFVFDGQGAPVRDSAGEFTAIRYPGMTQILALAANADTLYAGDNNLLRVLSFRRAPGFPFSGDAAGFDGPVAAIGIDPAGGLIVLPGGGNSQPLHLDADSAWLPSGVLWSDAISSGKLPAVWNRLRATVQDAPGSHIEFFYAISNSSTAPPVDSAAADPFSDPGWTELPNDVEDFLLSGDKASFLFVGAVFSGDRSSTPLLIQMRADFDDPGYLPYLPVIYRQPPADADFVRRYLALLQGIFDDIEGEMDTLARYFNPASAPEGSIPWLASWLAVDTDQGEPLPRIRAAIARAFNRYRWRGTAEGLKLALLEDAGVHANIVQPIANATFWAFPGDTTCSGVPSTPGGVQLGANTHLPSMQPGGAVLGSTAELDHSYLIDDTEFGEPLFDGSADQFVVEVYRSEIEARGRLALVKEVLEREKPAHAMYRLSILEASMRVGFQSRAGIDSIIAGTPGPSGLGVPPGVGGLRLGGGPEPRVGASRLGGDLKLE
jgi:phage tail-like protein